MITDNEPYLAKVKISAAYCREAYDITFLRGVQDIYGKDIDLTARLMSVAESQEIVMNAPFVEQVRTEYTRMLNKEQFECVKKIRGPWPHKFKGFESEGYIDIYKAHI